MDKNRSIGTVDSEEIGKFQKIAAEWWSPHGKFAPLHAMNRCRLGYIRSRIVQHFVKSENSLKPFRGLRLLDVGCGGGLIAEPMARMGAGVTAIDASEKAIEVARLHAAQSGLNIDYRLCDVESLASAARFDVVLALELVEHVADLELFLSHAVRCLKPGGLLGISTLNRTMKSYIFAIIGAEYILGLLPRGTHDWRKFVRPSELVDNLRKDGLSPFDICGMSFDMSDRSWRINRRDLSVNYIGFFKKD